jgi:hypothetical protein
MGTINTLDSYITHLIPKFRECTTLFQKLTADVKELIYDTLTFTGHAWELMHGSGGSASK